MNTFPREQMVTALENMGEDAESVLREDYSGKFMYGQECLGLTLTSESELAKLAIELGRQAAFAAEEARSESYSSPDVDELFDRISGLFESLRSDSMGRSAIFYFPGWTLAD